MTRSEGRIYLVVTGLFLLLIAGLAWKDSGKLLFDETRYFWALPDNYLRPSLSLEVMPGDHNSIELTLLTTNYSFSKLCNGDIADQQVVQGHAHLYVNGRKLESLYVPFAVIDDLPPGEHVISASLHVLPNHQAITIDGKPIADERTLRITGAGIEIVETSSATNSQIRLPVKR